MIRRYSAEALQGLGSRGAADLTRSPRRQGVGAAAGDYCSGGCPVDGEGRVHHRCGYPPGSNVQVFTTIATISASFELTYTSTSGLFCPEFFMINDENAYFVIVDDIEDPNGDSLLLGPNSVIGEFFASKNDRGNRIEGCCVPAALSITVRLREMTNSSAPQAPTNQVQGSFWGALR